MRTIIYIHGLFSSSKTSSKFATLKSNFENVIAFDWDAEDTTIQSKLQKLAVSLVESGDDVTIIGDSTGANFAMQLRSMMQDVSKFSYAKLILVSPLFSVDALKLDIMPVATKRQVVATDYIKDALVLMPLNDEVVKYEYVKLNNVKLISQNVSHAFETFAEHIEAIKAYNEVLSI